MTSGAIGTFGSMEYDGRRPRLSVELAARVDAVRGQVPFERWVRGALEQALDGQGPGDTSSVASPRRSGSAKEAAPTEPPTPARAPEPEVPYELPKIAKRKW
jgi:hypothetical protein